MAASGTNSRQSELGDFLRSRRQKLMPKVVGLPVGRRRRTPGLRRAAGARPAGPRLGLCVPLRRGAAVRPPVEQLNLPAYVTGRRWDILAWNAAAEEIFAFSRLAEADRNSLLSVLTNPATRRLFGASWTDEARRIVAQFRATHDLWAGDPAFRDLLTRLREGCPEFAGWWEAHDISGVAAGRKSSIHPT